MPVGSVATSTARAKAILVDSDIANGALFPIVYLPGFLAKQSEMIIDFFWDDALFLQ